MRNQEEKIELQKKVHRRICLRDITLLAARPPSYVIFLSFFRLLRFYEKKKMFQKMMGGLAPPLPSCLVSTALKLVNLFTLYNGNFGF